MSEFKKTHALFFLVLIGAALYANSLHSPYIFDDQYNIVSNAAVHDLRFFWSYFTDPRTHNALPENAPYRPLTTLSHALMWAAGNGATWPYHVLKIFSHILVACLVFLISLRFAVLEVAFGGALLFLVHPALSETVNYISSTSTLQCSVFYLLGFYFFLKSRESRRKMGWLLAMSFCFFCSVMSKEEGVTFPGAVALYYLAFARTNLFSKENLKTFAWVLAPWCLYLILYLSMPQTVRFSDLTRDVYFFTQLRAWVYYLAGIFTPWGYSVEHMGFGYSRSFWDAAVFFSALVNATLLFFAARAALVRKNSVFCFLGFGLLWFYLTLLPASSVFPLSEPINEHRYYLSYALLFPALVSAARILIERFRVPLNPARLVFGALCLVLCALTFQQNVIWTDDESIWANTVKQDPENGRAHLNYGLTLLQRHRMEETYGEFQSCVKYMPLYLYCYVNLGTYYNAVGRTDDATKAFEKAVAVSPQSVVALGFAGEHFVLTLPARAPEGVEYLKRCDAVAEGKNEHCLYLLSYGLRELKRYDEALEAARRMAALDPNNKQASFEVGMDLMFLSRWDEAKKLFEAEVQRDPREPNAFQNLAWIAAQQKDWPSVKEYWRRNLALLPGFLGGWRGLREAAQHLNDQALLQECDTAIARLEKK